MNIHTPLWPDHWSKGGTGITQTKDQSVANELAETVRLFGNPEIFMKGMELHSTLQDLSDFWAFHRRRLGKE